MKGVVSPVFRLIFHSLENKFECDSGIIPLGECEPASKSELPYAIQPSALILSIQSNLIELT